MTRCKLLSSLVVLALAGGAAASPAQARTHARPALPTHRVVRHQAAPARPATHTRHHVKAALPPHHGSLALFQAPLPQQPRKVAASRQPAPLPSLTDLVGYFRQQGMRAYQAGRYRDAASQFRKVLDLKPDDQIAHARVLKLQGVAGRR